MDQGTFILELARRAAWLLSESQNRDFLRARVEEFFRRRDSGCYPLPRLCPSRDGVRLPAPCTLEALFPPYSSWGIGYDDFFLRDCMLMAIMHDGAWREDYGFDSERAVYFFEPIYIGQPFSNEPVTDDDRWAVTVYSELQEMPWLSTAEQVEAAKELIRQAFRRVEEVMPVEPRMEWEGFEPSSVFHDSVPRAVRKGWDPDMEAYRQRTSQRPPTDRERVAQFQTDCSACTAYFAKERIREHWLKQVEWHKIWSWGHEKIRPLDPDEPEDLQIIYAVMAFCMEKSSGTHVIPRCVIRGERRRFYTNPPVSAWICERGYSTWMRAYIEADLQKLGLLTAVEIVPRTNGSSVSGPGTSESEVPEPNVSPATGPGDIKDAHAPQNGWEVAWNGSLRDYMMAGDAREKYTNGRLTASSLSKKLGTIAVHFMRSGRRCRVHEAEFLAWAKGAYPEEYLTEEQRAEIADRLQSEVEQRKRMERKGRGK